MNFLWPLFISQTFDRCFSASSIIQSPQGSLRKEKGGDLPHLSRIYSKTCKYIIVSAESTIFHSNSSRKSSFWPFVRGKKFEFCMKRRCFSVYRNIFPFFCWLDVAKTFLINFLFDVVEEKENSKWRLYSLDVDGGSSD